MASDSDPMVIASGMVSKLMAKTPFLHVIEWEGSKIPRGATVGGQEIGWTQHGMVTSKEGNSLGFYERLEEFGGPSGKRHKMLVGTNHDTAANPDGTPCRIAKVEQKQAVAAKAEAFDATPAGGNVGDLIRNMQKYIEAMPEAERRSLRDRFQGYLRRYRQG